MIEIKNKKKCSGCRACYSICPLKCIKMEMDSEGYEYPKVNKEKCIKCNKCIEVCSFMKPLNRIETSKVYACQNKDKKIMSQSSSGGYFTLVAEEIFSQNGVVYGAVYSDSFKVVHDRIDCVDDLYKLRGSKYVQSNVLGNYNLVKKDLEDKIKVVFSGTPCQISGLKKFLNKEYDNLILLDIICHGVPSPKIYKEYLQSLERKFRSKITKVNFREKKIAIQGIKIDFENKESHESIPSKDPYYMNFSSDILLRPSCYDCKSNNHRSGADITLADYWGCSELFPEFNERKEGVSLVIPRTRNGKILFEKLKEKIDYKESTIKHSIKKNKNIEVSCEMNVYRKYFFKDYLKGKYEISELLEKYAYPSLKLRIKGKILRILKKRGLKFFKIKELI